jgi:tetratricopeptide (TPR) repeat protein
MRRIQNYFRTIAIAIVIFIGNIVSGQSIDEAMALYNEGVEAKSEDSLEFRVQKFQDFIRIADQLTEDDTYEIYNEINSVKAALPQLTLQLSQTKLKEKDMQNGLAYALTAKELAEKYNDSDVLEKSVDLLGKIYYSQGLSMYKAQDYDGALVEIDKSIQEDNNLKAHNLKLVILKEKGEESKLIDAAKTAISAAKVVNDQESAQKFAQFVGTYFYNEGVLAKQASNNDVALEKILISLNFYPDNPDAHYLITSIYNSNSDWDEAIAAANEGLKYEVQGNEARFYYELGTAYFGKGDNAAACEAFSKAAVGEYTENAKYQMEHVVKCN